MSEPKEFTFSPIDGKNYAMNSKKESICVGDFSMSITGHFQEINANVIYAIECRRNQIDGTIHTFDIPMAKSDCNHWKTMREHFLRAVKMNGAYLKEGKSS